MRSPSHHNHCPISHYAIHPSYKPPSALFSSIPSTAHTTSPTKTPPRCLTVFVLRCQPRSSSRLSSKTEPRLSSLKVATIQICEMGRMQMCISYQGLVRLWTCKRGERGFSFVADDSRSMLSSRSNKTVLRRLEDQVDSCGSLDLMILMSCLKFLSSSAVRRAR